MVTGSHPGPGRQPRIFSSTSCLFYFGILLALLPHYWLAICLLGIVLRILPVASPLGGCLLMVRLLGLLLKERRLVLLMLSLGRLEWVSGAGGGGKRVRLNRKTPAHHVLQGYVVFSLDQRIGRDFAVGLLLVVIVLMRKGGDCISMIGIMVLGTTGLGLAEDFSGVYRTTSPGLHGVFSLISA